MTRTAPRWHARHPSQQQDRVDWRSRSRRTPGPLAGPPCARPGRPRAGRRRGRAVPRTGGGGPGAAIGTPGHGRRGPAEPHAHGQPGRRQSCSPHRPQPHPLAPVGQPSPGQGPGTPDPNHGAPEVAVDELPVSRSQEQVSPPGGGDGGHRAMGRVPPRRNCSLGASWNSSRQME